MASNNSKKSKKPSQSPAAQRKTSQTNKVNLDASRNDEMTVVGIGASAGGLNALQEFFRSLPGATEMAYVVITHLHPEHESHLAELLQRHTQMPVRQVTGLIPVERDHVYVIPPNRRLVMQDGHIDTVEFSEPRGQRAPIDYFFRSLARGHPNSVGVILSGGGTDGAVGVKAIKEEGGLLMVQDPEEAEYDSMPQAAIATGLADVVLPVKELAAKLVELTRFRPPLPSDADELTEQQRDTIRRILAHVHTRTGHDFSQYKRATLLRRIQRRMQLHGASRLELYLDVLRENPGEATALFNDILIGVTSFFRDRDSWEQLARQVIPEILKGKASTEPVRTWTVGCSTGEEAYGMAMLLIEAFEALEVRPRIQIFASDLDENSIKLAREGLYPTAIEADVSAERLQRFFKFEGNHYRVRKEVRDVVLFTPHSVLRDAPFSRLDLISCRNLLIYLERELQNTVFDIFHYSLKPDGYLFLGGSESVDAAQELFQTVDKQHRIYRARPWGHRQPHIPSLPLAVAPSPHVELYSQLYTPRTPTATAPPRPSDDHLKALEAQAPPSVLINDQYAVLHISATAGRYLNPPAGPITTDLLKLVRPELQLELRTALLRVFETDRAVLTSPVPVRFNGHPHRVILSIRPHSDGNQEHGKPNRQALIFFLEDEQGEPAPDTVQEPDETLRNAYVLQLETDVRRMREQLQLSIEQYESSSEELRASNEELQSINEEYRSATEELETSKEELQSVNEELQTVNNELKNKLEEVSLSHSDLENLMAATEIATLFLDHDLRIRHYTPGMQKLFNIMPGDRGRPIQHLTHTLRYSQFLEDAKQVLRTLVPSEREVQGEEGRWFLLRMRPFRTLDDRIAGVIFTFVEITQIKQVEEELIEVNQKLARARDLFLALFDANPVPTALIRMEDEVFLNINEQFLAYFGFPREEVIGHSAQEFDLGLGMETKDRQGFFARVKRERRMESYETSIRRPTGDVRNILAAVQYIELDHTDALISTFVDITDRVQAEQQVRTLASELTASEQAERHRLSQILHDDLQQRLFAIQMHLSFLREAYEKNDLRAFQADFPQLEEWLAQSIRVTRQLSVDLSPPILRGEGLLEAVIWLSAQVNEQYGLAVDIRANGTPAEIDEKVRVLTFYAVRELLFNVVKHARILKAAVQFEHEDQRLLVIVSDHGAGFDSIPIMSNPLRAHGLLVIRDRLSLLGCTMEVNSQPGLGTEAIIEIPYGSRDGQA